MAELILLDRRYELLETLASGGEAEVHRGRDRQSGREVALRLLLSAGGGRPEESPAKLPEFHPGWVRFLGAGADPKRGPYQVFELLRGETLRRKMDPGPLEARAWLVFARESLAAVAALHAAGWTHADLNADNFFQIEDKGAWKLLELPFLRCGRPASHPALFGSLQTLAPERIDGHAADAASDVYALGCLYYYAASGVYPHGVGSAPDLAVARLRFAPEPLAEKAPALPGAWAGWVMTLLERQPPKRPDAATAARHLLAVA